SRRRRTRTGRCEQSSRMLLTETVSGHDPRRILSEVYDNGKPLTGTRTWLILSLPGTMRRMASTAERSLSQLRRGVLEYCVLALLRRRRYGIELLRELGKVELMATSEGTIYPLLSRLRREGLVETTWQESNSGPPRRYYELTSAGAQALDEF